MVYVILGQTASGKTSLAVRLARDFKMPLIGADAYQVYKELNIGTAKPSEDELSGLTFHLINDRSLTSPLDVREYQQECRKLLDYYQERKQDVILSGGTFLYVRAALYPYEFKEEKKDPALEAYVENLSLEEAVKQLKEKDEESYSSVDLKNPRRVKRALIMAYKGEKKSFKAKESPFLIYPAEIYAIDIDRDAGNKKINERVDEMFNEGLLTEVKEILSKYDPSLTSLHAIGYSEVINGLKNNLSEEEIKEQIKLDTRRYAKRQRTFLRHQFPGIKFMPAEDIYKAIEKEAEQSLKN